MNWPVHIIGVDNPVGRWELFWSGFGSDISQFAIIGALLALVRRHNCHVHGCWRVGRHPVQGTAYVVCRRHHPDGAPSHADVLKAAGR